MHTAETENRPWTATKLPCPACGSSDAVSINSAGWSRCFSCGDNRRVNDTDAPERAPKAAVAGLINDLDFRAIASRGIDEATARKFSYGIGKDHRGNPVQVAQYFRDGAVVAQKIRGRDKAFSVLGGGHKMPLYGQHLWGSTGRMVVVTEGEIDALTVSQLQDNKWPVVSLPSGAQAAAATFKQHLAWLEGYEKVIIMFDMDEPGQAAAQLAAEVLTPGKAFIASLPLKDPNDCLLAGKGEDVRKAIWNASPWRPDAILAGSDLWERVKSRKAPEGVPWPWESLNGRGALLAMTRPAIHTLVAGTGSGKSTICRALEHHLISLGENVGCLHLEEDPEHTAMGIVGYELGARIDMGHAGVDPASLAAAFARTAGRDGVFFYDSFGSTSVDNILAKVRYLAKAGACNYVILDHLSIVVSGLAVADERKAIDLAMTQLRTLVQETGIGLILVSHLSRGEGKDPEKGGEVSLKMLRGSQAIAQLSDTVSAIERDQQGTDDERNLSLWRILKCRLTGSTGPCTKLLYDRDTGRLADVGLTYETCTFTDDDVLGPARDF